MTATRMMVELDDAVRRHQRVVCGSEMTPVPTDRACALRRGDGNPVTIGSIRRSDAPDPRLMKPSRSSHCIGSNRDRAGRRVSSMGWNGGRKTRGGAGYQTYELTGEAFCRCYRDCLPVMPRRSAVDRSLLRGNHRISFKGTRKFRTCRETVIGANPDRRWRPTGLALPSPAAASD